MTLQREKISVLHLDQSYIIRFQVDSQDQRISLSALPTDFCDIPESISLFMFLNYLSGAHQSVGW